jgi:hypothetical protein
MPLRRLRRTFFRMRSQHDAFVAEAVPDSCADFNSFFAMAALTAAVVDSGVTPGRVATFNACTMYS